MCSVGRGPVILNLILLLEQSSGGRGNVRDRMPKPLSYWPFDWEFLEIYNLGKFLWLADYLGIADIKLLHSAWSNYQNQLSANEFNILESTMLTEEGKIIFDQVGSF